MVTSPIMDEAEHCQDLVLIRAGKLLAHGTPEHLREHTHTRTIEETFMKLEGRTS